MGLLQNLDYWYSITNLYLQPRNSDRHVQKVFKMGVKVWNDFTCIDFAEDKNGSLWAQQIGSAIHEIGHVLGLYHTMSRYDRDNYIKVNDSDFYGLTYDYGSIIGSVNQHPTMIATDANYQKTMGSDLIAFSDIFVVNEHYGCNGLSTSAKCVNEGFPHPRDCSICICPSGYGGALCDQRVVNENEFVLASGISFRFLHFYDLGKTVLISIVEVVSLSRGYDKPGCPKGGVEIKAQNDQKMTGYRMQESWLVLVTFPAISIFVHRFI
uniref:ZnMc domain-containing protein n=1 Tax=Angiostrongylus cantonensis TaxID=6313 RepID=A0A0K0D1Y4_ANGCA